MTAGLPPPSLAPEGELRLATVVACDLVDSTALLGALDPSDRLKVSRALRRLVEGVAARHGGWLERWDGDGATLVFGYPEVHENAPEVAVRAGMELIAGVRRVGVPAGGLVFRVGVASGELAVDLATGEVAGHAFNMADRLRAAGEPGWIVVGDATRRLAGAFFAYDDLGSVAAKGFGNGLRAWRVVGETNIASRFTAHRTASRRSALIGRTVELEVAAGAWWRAAAGRGSVVLLTGDAGIGKSRIAWETTEYAMAHGAGKIEIACTPSTRNSPLFPLGVLLRRLARITAASTSDEGEAAASRWLASILPTDDVPSAVTFLAPLFGLPARPPAGMAPETIQERTIAVLVTMLQAVAATQALVVLCEDVHWADDTTARVIERLALTVGSLPALILVTARPDSDGPIHAGRLGPTCTTLALEPLATAHASALVHGIAGTDRLSPTMVERIVGRCEGIPLILEELTRGALDGQVPGTAPASTAELATAVPAPLQLVVESRLEGWRQYKPIVQAAAVIGREFPVAALRELTAGRGDDLADAIQLLAANGWFSRRASASDERIRFKHAMIRDSVYNTLLRDDRRELHSRVADVLAGGKDATPDAIAHHLCEGQRFLEAIRLRLAASVDTTARGAYVEGEGHCRAGLAIVHHVDDPALRAELNFRLLVQLCVPLVGRHGYSAPPVEAAYLAARAAYDDSAGAETLYPILRGLAAMNHVRGNYRHAYSLSTECIAVAEQARRPAFLIDALGIHAYSTFYTCRYAEARAAVQRCLALYDAEDGGKLAYPVPNDPKTAALAIGPSIEWTLGEAGAAEAMVREGAAHAAGVGQPFDEALVKIHVASLRITQRRFVEGGHAAAIVKRLGDDHQQRHWTLMGEAMAAVAEACRGPAPAALAAARTTGRELAEHGVGTNVAWNLRWLARGFVHLGDHATSATLVERALAYSAEAGDERMVAELLMAKAEIASGRDARGFVERALAAAQACGDVSDTLRAAAWLACDAGGDTAFAVDTLDRLEGRLPVPETPGWMHDRYAALQRGADAPRQIMAAE